MSNLATTKKITVTVKVVPLGIKPPTTADSIYLIAKASGFVGTQNDFWQQLVTPNSNPLTKQDW